jgi:DNA-binding HxlR family transcriptional regulator
MTSKKEQDLYTADCGQDTLLAIKDTMLLLSGKWKLQILGSFMLYGKMRFMDLRREIPGIAAKMLAKELRDLELNELISRKVMDTRPVTVEYDLTSHGTTLQPIIESIRSWGVHHRKHLFGKNTQASQDKRQEENDR